MGDLCFSSPLACSCLMEYGNLLLTDQLVSGLLSLRITAELVARLSNHGLHCGANHSDRGVTVTTPTPGSVLLSYVLFSLHALLFFFLVFFR